MSKSKKPQDPRYAKPGSPPPTPEQIDEMSSPVREALAALHQARYEARVALAARDLARAQAKAQRAHLEHLQRQLEKLRGGK